LYCLSSNRPSINKNMKLFHYFELFVLPSIYMIDMDSNVFIIAC